MIKVEKTIDIIRLGSLGEQEGEGESDGESFKFMRVSMGGGGKFMRVKVGGGRRGYCNKKCGEAEFLGSVVIKTMLFRSEFIFLKRDL